MPDAAMALNVILSRLFVENGKVPVPGFYDGVIPLTAQQRKWLRELPSNEKKLRREFGVLPQARLANHVDPYEQMSRQPAVTIIAQEASTMAQRSNQVLSRATAAVSCRLAPGQTAARIKEAVTRVLTKDPPWNARVTVTGGRGLDPWMTDPAGPAFEAARHALQAGFGKSPAMIGSGGSIGFVAPMAKLLDNAPVLMLGIEDPHSNAHAPNESMHEGDLLKLTRSLAHLFENLSSIPRSRLH
jgi:acetylornithine deacetylase/succinyl-diaminopimelate desuccinylase-like protein